MINSTKTNSIEILSRQYSRQARNFKIEGKYEAAIATLNEGLHKDPNNTFLECGLADVYRNMGEIEEARRTLHKVLSIEPQNAFALDLLNKIDSDKRKKDVDAVVLEVIYPVTRLRRVKKFEEALKLLEEADKRFPNEARISAYRGTIHVALNNLDFAKQCFQEAIRINPNFDLPYLHLGGVAQSEGQWKEAENNFLKAFSISPANGKVLECLGLFYAEQNQPEKATQYFLNKNELSPDLENLFTIATIYIKAGKIEEAKKWFGEIIIKDPKNIRALLEMGNIYMKNRQVHLAKDYFIQALRYDPSNGFAVHQLSRIYLSGGNPKKAVAILEHKLKDHQGSPSLKSVLAKAYIASKQYYKAEIILRELIEKNPHHFMVQNLLGDVHLKKGEYHEAEKYYLKVLLQEPNSRYANNGLGRIHIEINDFEIAKAYFEKVLETYPDDLCAIKNLERINGHAQSPQELSSIAHEKLVF